MREGSERSAGRDRALSRLTARSVVLSVLLGAHPAWASASELVTLTADFGIKEPTLRVALTRMVGAGDLVRSADGYRLSERLLARQRRQDDALDPRLRQWDGTWTTLVITSVGSDARSRASIRTTLHHRRFGELREGVWMRPDNLEQAARRRPARPAPRAGGSRRGFRGPCRRSCGTCPPGRGSASSCSNRCAGATDTAAAVRGGCGRGPASADRSGAARGAATRELAWRRIAPGVPRFRRRPGGATRSRAT